MKAAPKPLNVTLVHPSDYVHSLALKEAADYVDAMLLRAWAVLNLHKADDTIAFAPIRCFYPLINGIPVISEDTTDASATPFRDCHARGVQEPLARGGHACGRGALLHRWG